MGDDFVLNVLGEKQSTPTMGHFLKRFPAGADRFEGVEWLPAKNGSPVLRSSIAHLELKVRWPCCRWNYSRFVRTICWVSDRIVP